MATDQVRPTASEEGDPVKPDRPLALRLYACPHLVALVRLFGDRELSADEVKRGMASLDEQFGKERMLTAAKELLVSISYGRTLVFRLNIEVRKLAVQILGPIPAAVAASAGVPSTSYASHRPAASQPIVEPSTSEAPTRHEESPTDDPVPADYQPTDDAEACEKPERGIENFETFLIHFWLTGSEELCEYCMGLVEQVREDVSLCEEVTEQGWSLEAAAIHYVAKDLRVFVAQEALASRTDQMHDSYTREMLDRVDWRELAESFLSDE